MRLNDKRRVACRKQPASLGSGLPFCRPISNSKCSGKACGHTLQGLYHFRMQVEDHMFECASTSKLSSTWEVQVRKKNLLKQREGFKKIYVELFEEITPISWYNSGKGCTTLFPLNILNLFQEPMFQTGVSTLCLRREKEWVTQLVLSSVALFC